MFTTLLVFALLVAVMVTADTEIMKFHAKLQKSGGACQNWGEGKDQIHMMPELTSVVDHGSFLVYTNSQGTQAELIASGSVMGNGKSAFKGGCAVVKNDEKLIAPWFMLPCSCSTQMTNGKNSSTTLMLCDIQIPGKDGGPHMNFLCTGEYAVTQA